MSSTTSTEADSIIHQTAEKIRLNLFRGCHIRGSKAAGILFHAFEDVLRRHDAELTGTAEIGEGLFAFAEGDVSQSSVVQSLGKFRIYVECSVVTLEDFGVTAG